MKILGISSGHDAGAAIIEDNQVLAAINEERLNREKLYWGSPLLSISECLRIANLSLKDIDEVVFANLTNGAGIQREFRSGRLTFKKRLFDASSYTGLLDKKIIKKIYLFLLGGLRSERETFKLIRENGFNSSCRYLEHHLAHAASAYYTSPFNLDDKVLVVTTDGSGDGIGAAIFTINQNGFLKRRNETSFYHSPGAFYSNITYNLGFKPLNQESKITGLAAYGQPEKTLDIFRKYLKADLKKLEYRGYDSWGVAIRESAHVKPSVSVYKKTGKFLK